MGQPFIMPSQRNEASRRAVKSPLMIARTTSGRITMRGSSFAPQGRSSRAPLLSRFLLLRLLLLLFGSVVQVKAAWYDSCFAALTAADDGDNILTQAEYEAVVQDLTQGAVNASSFDQYTSGLQTAFRSRIMAGSPGVNIFGSSVDDGASDQDSQHLQAFCGSIYAGLVQEFGIGVTQNECHVALTVGDSDRDNMLTDNEFAGFVTKLDPSNSATSFDSLADPFKTVFQDFSTPFSTGDSVIDVTGSKPGATAPAGTLDFLLKLCQRTEIAVRASQQQVSVAEGGVDFTACTRAMAGSDINRNGFIEASAPSYEYVRFINKLDNNAYQGMAFSDLPDVLQQNYADLAGPNGIDISGSKPGQVPTAEEQARLQNICEATAAAIEEAGDPLAPPPVSPPTPSPAPAPTSVSSPVSSPAPTASGAIEYSVCRRYMTQSDSNRDSALDKSEYFRFVNFAGDRQWLGLSFDKLPQVLQDNFDALANSNGVISVAGSGPGQTPTPDEEAHLKNVCDSTAAAIKEASEKPPTVAPVALKPTAAPVATGNSTAAPTSTGGPVDSPVYNAYLISNQDSFTAASLQSGPNRQALDDGYLNFTLSEFNKFLQQYSRALMVRDGARRLQNATNIRLVEDSIKNYLIKDTTCPEDVVGTCQNVYATFVIRTSNVEDPSVVVSKLTLQTQAAIQEGVLQSFVEAADSDVKVTVEKAIEPLRPATAAPTVEPQPYDGDKANDDSGGGKNTGAIVGAVVAILLVAILGAFAYWYVVKKGKKIECGNCKGWLPSFSLPSMPKRGGAKSNKTIDEQSERQDDMDGHDEDDEMNDGFWQSGRNELNGPPSNKKSIFSSANNKDTSSSSVDYDDHDEEHGERLGAFEEHGYEEDNKQEKGGGNVFGAFGTFGKNRRSSGNADDSLGDLEGADAFHENPADDYADYGFDDPAADMDMKSTNEDLFINENSASQKDWESSPGGWGDGGSFQNSRDGPSSSASGSRGPSDERDDSRSFNDDESGSEDESYIDDYEEDSGPSRTPSGSVGSMPENMRHMDAMVGQGNWDGVMAAASKYETNHLDNEDGSEPSQPSLQKSESLSHSQSESQYSDEDGTDADNMTFDDMENSLRDADDGTIGESSAWSYSSEEVRRRSHYRGQIESLVRRVVPDELDNVSAMMDQFAGREAELINTLQAMQERSTSQRARKAVHKSKAMPQFRENGGFAAGGTEGSAAIAAASTLGVQNGDFEDQAFDEREEEEASQGYDDYYDDEGDYQEGDSQYSGSQSQYSGSQSQSAYSEDQGSYVEDDIDEEYGSSEYGSGSQRSGSYRSGSYRSGSYKSGSYDQDEGSYYSDDDRGHSQGDGSYYSGEDRSHSGSRSYYDDEGPSQSEGSYCSEEPSQSEGTFEEPSQSEGTFEEPSQSEGTFDDGF